MVVVPDKQAHANEGQQELEGYDENVDHNGYGFKSYMFGDMAHTQLLRFHSGVPTYSRLPTM